MCIAICIAHGRTGSIENQEKDTVMTMKENYVFPARFERTGQDRLKIIFPDFPEILTEAESFEQALGAAQEALAVTIMGYDAEKRKIPEPSFYQKDVVYVHIWMPFYKNMAREVYVRKSVTIPEWLNILAGKNSVNYSAALVKGIKAELGIEE